MHKLFNDGLTNMYKQFNDGLTNMYTLFNDGLTIKNKHSNTKTRFNTYDTGKPVYCS